MVNGTAPAAAVRRREIVAADHPGLVDLLARGLPSRPVSYWERGLERMARRTDVPRGCPRFGILLEAGGRPVGALLMLFRAEGNRLLCNLSSWTVEPAYRLHAPLLVAGMLRRTETTFVNLSAAPYTRSTIVAQGFAPFAIRTTLVLPSLGRPRSIDVAFPQAGRFGDLSEAGLLEEHLTYGCIVAVTTEHSGPQPFVFLPLRVRSGRLPVPLVQLVYCRDLDAYRRLSGPLGRALLGRGVLGIVAEEPGAPSIWDRLLGERRRQAYVRGPAPPRAGDLAYTERVVFGP